MDGNVVVVVGVVICVARSVRCLPSVVVVGVVVGADVGGNVVDVAGVDVIVARKT